MRHAVEDDGGAARAREGIAFCALDRDRRLRLLRIVGDDVAAPRPCGIRAFKGKVIPVVDLRGETYPCLPAIRLPRTAYVMSNRLLSARLSLAAIRSLRLVGRPGSTNCAICAKARSPVLDCSYRRHSRGCLMGPDWEKLQIHLARAAHQAVR